MKAKLNATHPGHHRSEQEEQALPMPGDIGFWKLDADSKYTDSKNDTGKLDSDGIRYLLVTISPTSGIEYSGTIWSCIEK